MFLSCLASSAPIFILIGPGLVWQTLPAGWVDTFESHYIAVKWYRYHHCRMSGCRLGSSLEVFTHRHAVCPSWNLHAHSIRSVASIEAPEWDSKPAACSLNVTPNGAYGPIAG